MPRKQSTLQHEIMLSIDILGEHARNLTAGEVGMGNLMQAGARLNELVKSAGANVAPVTWEEFPRDDGITGDTLYWLHDPSDASDAANFLTYQWDPEAIVRPREREQRTQNTLQRWRLWAETLAGEDEAAEQPPAGGKAAKGKWLAEAMLMVRDNPEWSDSKIARAVGRDKGRLSRSREYQAAAALARKQQPKPSGSVTVDPKTKDRTLEAIDESGGEESQEEIDARIDRETAKTQRYPQREKCE